MDRIHVERLAFLGFRGTAPLLIGWVLPFLGGGLRLVFLLLPLLGLLFLKLLLLERVLLRQLLGLLLMLLL
jgi:hypothetical protein